MSLRETIEGARREAAAAGTLGSGASRNDEAPEPEENAKQQKQGFSRRSSARAKPTREVAGSIRSGSSSTAEKTKEEKKRDRQERRDKEDLKFDAREALLKTNDEYAKAHRNWLIMMGVGGAILLLCFFFSRFAMTNDATTNLTLMITAILVIIAYALVIASIVYDYRKIRPMRKQVEDQVKGMTPKRMRRVIADAAKAEEAKKAAKKK